MKAFFPSKQIAIDVLKKNSSALLKGESLCSTCAQTDATSYSENEWKTLFALTHSRDIDILSSIEVEKQLEEKIENLFKENAKGGT